MKVREETRVATLRAPLPVYAQHAAPSLARSTARAAARDEAPLRQRRATTSQARLNKGEASRPDCKGEAKVGTGVGVRARVGAKV